MAEPKRSTVTWRGGMAFDGQVEAVHVPLDALPEHGGGGQGATPKPFLLMSLGACTGMDIAAILAKMKVELAGFAIDLEGTTVETHPKRFDRIVVRYRFDGADLPLDKLARAIQLSEDKYCGVRASLHPDIALVSEIWVNGALVRAPSPTTTLPAS
jgi:putative redox protein